MNQSKITVRLDEAGRTATLEIRRSLGTTDVPTVIRALRRIGVYAKGTMEFFTPRHHVVCSQLVSFDGTPLDSTKVMQVLSATREYERLSMRPNRWAA
jgi:hypothetical protein